MCKEGDVGYMGPIIPFSAIGEMLVFALMWSLSLVRRLPNDMDDRAL